MSFCYKSILLLLIISLVSCSSSQLSTEVIHKQAADSLAHEIRQILGEGHFNGLAVAIVNEKGALYKQGFGFSDVATQKPYTEHTLQPIASVSKTLVGLALMKAVELGKLKLDDPVNRYLNFKVANPHYPEVPITIRQLANHTSTIPDNDSYLTKNYVLTAGQDTTGLPMSFEDTQYFNSYSDSIESLASFLKNSLSETGRWYQKERFPKRKPGEGYEYSNTGTTLAAYIIESATGMPFDEFTKTYILTPLKMNASGWHYPDVNFVNCSKLYADPKTRLPFYTSITYPDGGFISSAGDMALYLTELIKGYKGQGTILSRASYAELFRQQLSTKHFTERNESNPYNESYNVGVFMGFSYTGNVGHTGGDPGVLSILFFDPKTGIGRLMVINTSITDQAGGQAFYAMYDALAKYASRLGN